MILMKLGLARSRLCGSSLCGADTPARCFRLGDRSEAQRIHHRHRPCAHGENIAQNAANASRRSLKRLDETRMIMRFDFEGARPAVADVDDARVLARPLQHQLAARGQSLQVHARRFVGAVLAPHHAENAEFGERWLAPAKKLFDFFVLVLGKAVRPKSLRRESCRQGGGHGETLLSHFSAGLGRETRGELEMPILGRSSGQWAAISEPPRLKWGGRRVSRFSPIPDLAESGFQSLAGFINSLETFSITYEFFSFAGDSRSLWDRIDLWDLPGSLHPRVAALKRFQRALWRRIRPPICLPNPESAPVLSIT